MTEAKTFKVALACQGGGTHGAFTWGVLTEILKAHKSWNLSGGHVFDITAISGTSSGALNALATWYGLADPNRTHGHISPSDRAIERLDCLWETFGATRLTEMLHNHTAGLLFSLESLGIPLPSINPYALPAKAVLGALESMGAREAYLGFDALLSEVFPNFDNIDLWTFEERDPRVLVGAVEVVSGNFEVFDSHKNLEDTGRRPNGGHYTQRALASWRMRRPLSLNGVAASGTLPEVLPARVIPDLGFPTVDPNKPQRRDDGYYWDGLYSQNPPIREFFDAITPNEKPDEIWVIRINPQEQNIFKGAITLEEIKDRQNELVGNMALNQELDHIMTINEWMSMCHTQLPPPFDDLKPITVRTIKMKEETAMTLRSSTKFDRNPTHLEKLRDEGIEVASKWLTEWRKPGTQFACYPGDARY